MMKMTKVLWCTVVILLLFAVGSMTGDLDSVQQGVVRLHVVADSDQYEDQQVKIAVKDAVVAYLKENMKTTGSTQEAKQYLNESIDSIKAVAENTLLANGFDKQVSVTLAKEEFMSRDYDTFSLPSGVYDALRITIGSGKGKNWWCVVFPSLCLGATTNEFKSIAVTSGFDNQLTNTLAKDEGYEIRFFFLDCLGKIENFLHFG